LIKKIPFFNENEIRTGKQEYSKMAAKHLRGQFYTTKYEYILEGFSKPPACTVIEPFAGKGDLLNWLNGDYQVEAYDIEPKAENILKRDTLRDPPVYTDKWILTNPPYLARNKCEDKELFDKYETNDLYKCFLNSLTSQASCRGGILIIPAGFFLSPRDVDTDCRKDFLRQYKLLKVKYFEEQVFDDTTTTVVAVAFEKATDSLREQHVEWVHMPTGRSNVFEMKESNGWIIGGDIYSLPIEKSIKLRRHVEGQPLKVGEQQTFLTLNALDSGTQIGRISLEYKQGYVYPAKESSRTFATLRIQGKTLSEDEQKDLSNRFNVFLEQKREETWSLFLPQYRESKEYARKRIPFELVYRIVAHLISAE
jgi:hypothetical protein